jgi:hypothetical protein
MKRKGELRQGRFAQQCGKTNQPGITSQLTPLLSQRIRFSKRHTSNIKSVPMNDRFVLPA